MFRVVFWDILPCKMIVDQSFYTAVYLRRQLWTSYSPLWELEISQKNNYFEMTILIQPNGIWGDKNKKWKWSDPIQYQWLMTNTGIILWLKFWDETVGTVCNQPMCICTSIFTHRTKTVDHAMTCHKMQIETHSVQYRRLLGTVESIM
jgi:hypothetical protein